MRYDGLSRRIAKKVEQQNAVTLIWTVVEYQGYLYDGWNCIMCVRLNNDATASTPPTVRGRLASYVWGPDIGSSSRQGANWQTVGGVGGLLFVSQGTNVDTSYTGTPAYDAFYAASFFPLWDRMGNITGYRKASTSTTDSALATTGAMLDYDAFGKEIRSSGPAADKIPFHFSSKFTDIETGLNYYGYRYYDPGNGRWLGRDPIGEQGGENLYGMVGNNLNLTLDVLGLTGCSAKKPPPSSTRTADGTCSCDILIYFGHAGNSANFWIDFKKKFPKAFETITFGDMECGEAGNDGMNKQGRPPHPIATFPEFPDGKWTFGRPDSKDAPWSWDKSRPDCIDPKIWDKNKDFHSRWVVEDAIKSANKSAEDLCSKNSCSTVKIELVLDPGFLTPNEFFGQIDAVKGRDAKGNVKNWLRDTKPEIKGNNIIWTQKCNP